MLLVLELLPCIEAKLNSGSRLPAYFSVALSMFIHTFEGTELKGGMGLFASAQMSTIFL